MSALLEQYPLSQAWQAALKNELTEPYLVQLAAFLGQQKSAGKTCFPADKDVFNALNSTPPEQVKVVIIGQDPYHGPGQAHGLCFSVAPGVTPPPSLKNIYKELQTDCQLAEADLSQGNLQSWADQGVLLLNAVLTVEAAKAASHQNRGWERFTDAVIAHVAAQAQAVVFILWGAYAQKKARIVDTSKHLLLSSAHPSPLSAYRGFYGSQPFSQANAFLLDHGRQAIAWTRVIQ